MITQTMAPQPLLATGRPGFESEEPPQLRTRSHTPEPSNGLNIGKMIIKEAKAIKERFIKIEKEIENEISFVAHEAEEEVSKLNKLKGYAYNLFHPDKSTVEESTKNPTSNKHNPAVALEPENIPPPSVSSETTAPTPATTASTSAPATEEAKEPRTTTISLTAPATTSTTTQPTPATTVTAAVTDTTTKVTSEPQTTDSATTRTTISKTASTTSITPPAAETTYSPSVLKTTNSPATPAATKTTAIAVNQTSSVRPTPAPTIQSVLHESVDSTMIGRLEDDLIAYHKKHPDIDISSLMANLDQTLEVYQLLYAATVISAFIRVIKKSHPAAAKFYEDKLDSFQSHLKNIKNNKEKEHIRHRRAPIDDQALLSSLLNNLIDLENAPMKEEMLDFFKGYEIARSKFSEMMRLKPAIHDSEFNTIFEHLENSPKMMDGLLKINKKIAESLKNSEYEAIGKYAFESNVLYNHLKNIAKKLPPTIQNDYEKYQYLFSKFEKLINRLPNYQTTTRHLLRLQSLYTWQFAYDALHLARLEQKIQTGFCMADVLTLSIAASSSNILPSLKYMAEAMIYGTDYLRYPFLVKYGLQIIYMTGSALQLANDLASLGLKSNSLYTEKMTKKVNEIFDKLQDLLEKETFTSAEDLLPRLIPTNFNGNSIKFAITPYEKHILYCSLEKTNNGYQLIIHDLQRGLLVLSADSLDSLRNELSPHLTKLCAKYKIPDKWSLQEEQHPLTKFQNIAIIPEDLLHELESIKIFPESELTVGEIMTTPPSELKQLDQKKVQDFFEHYLKETSKDANIARLKDTPKAPHKAHGASKSAPDSVNKNDPLITQCREVLTALDTPENTPIPDSIMQLHRQIIKQIMEISKQPAPQQIDVDKTPLGAENPDFLPDIHQASAIEAGSDSALISQATSADLQSLINPAIEIIPETLPGITPSQGNSASSQGNSASTLGGRIAGGGVASVFVAVTGALVSFKAACPSCFAQVARDAETEILMERTAIGDVSEEEADAALHSIGVHQNPPNPPNHEPGEGEGEGNIGRPRAQRVPCITKRSAESSCHEAGEEDAGAEGEGAEAGEAGAGAEAGEAGAGAAGVAGAGAAGAKAAGAGAGGADAGGAGGAGGAGAGGADAGGAGGAGAGGADAGGAGAGGAGAGAGGADAGGAGGAGAGGADAGGAGAGGAAAGGAAVLGVAAGGAVAGASGSSNHKAEQHKAEQHKAEQYKQQYQQKKNEKNNLIHSTSNPIRSKPHTPPPPTITHFISVQDKAEVTAGPPTTRSTTAIPTPLDERTNHQPSSSTTSTRPDSTSATTGKVTTQARVTADQPTTRSTTGTSSNPDERTTRQPSASTTSTQPDSTSATTGKVTTQARVTADRPTTRSTTGTSSNPDEHTTHPPFSSTTSTQPERTSASTGTVTTQAEVTAGQPTTRSTTGTSTTRHQDSTNQPSSTTSPRTKPTTSASSETPDVTTPKPSKETLNNRLIPSLIHHFKNKADNIQTRFNRVIAGSYQNALNQINRLPDHQKDSIDKRIILGDTLNRLNNQFSDGFARIYKSAHRQVKHLRSQSGSNDQKQQAAELIISRQLVSSFGDMYATLADLRLQLFTDAGYTKAKRLTRDDILKLESGIRDPKGKESFNPAMLLQAIESQPVPEKPDSFDLFITDLSHHLKGDSKVRQLQKAERESGTSSPLLQERQKLWSEIMALSVKSISSDLEAKQDRKHNLQTLEAIMTQEKELFIDEAQRLHFRNSGHLPGEVSPDELGDDMVFLPSSFMDVLKHPDAYRPSDNSYPNHHRPGGIEINSRNRRDLPQQYATSSASRHSGLLGNIREGLGKLAGYPGTPTAGTTSPLSITDTHSWHDSSKPRQLSAPGTADLDVHGNLVLASLLSSRVNDRPIGSPAPLTPAIHSHRDILDLTPGMRLLNNCQMIFDQLQSEVTAFARTLENPDTPVSQIWSRNDLINLAIVQTLPKAPASKVNEAFLQAALTSAEIGISTQRPEYIFRADGSVRGSTPDQPVFYASGKTSDNKMGQELARTMLQAMANSQLEYFRTGDNPRPQPQVKLLPDQFSQLQNRQGQRADSPSSVNALIDERLKVSRPPITQPEKAMHNPLITILNQNHYGKAEKLFINLPLQYQLDMLDKLQGGNPDYLGFGYVAESVAELKQKVGELKRTSTPEKDGNPPEWQSFKLKQQAWQLFTHLYDAKVNAPEEALNRAKIQSLVNKKSYPGSQHDQQHLAELVVELLPTQTSASIRANMLTAGGDTLPPPVTLHQFGPQRVNEILRSYETIKRHTIGLFPHVFGNTVTDPELIIELTNQIARTTLRELNGKLIPGDWQKVTMKNLHNEFIEFNQEVAA